MSQQPNIALLILTPLAERHPEWFPCIRDTFLDDPSHPELKDKVIMQCRLTEDNTQYAEHFKIPQTHPFYHSHYSIDEHHTGFVFDVPSKFKNDYKLIKQSKLHETSSQFQDTCHEIYKENPQILVMLSQLFDAPPAETESIT